MKTNFAKIKNGETLNMKSALFSLSLVAIAVSASTAALAQDQNSVAFFASKGDKTPDLLQVADARTSLYASGVYKAEDGSSEVRLNFDGFPPTPKAQKIEDRLILNFGQVALSAKQQPFTATSEVKGYDLKRDDYGDLILTVRLGEHGRFTTRKDSGGFVLKVYPSADQVVQKAVGFNGVSGIKFSRTKGGEDQTIIDLNNSATPVAVKQIGGKIQVRFRGNKLPANLVKTNNFNDLKAVVSSVKAYNEGLDGILDITPNGSYDYTAIQVDKRLTINVAKKQVVNSKSAASSDSVYSGKKISMDFQEAQITRVLQMLAKYVGVNIIVSDAVAGNVSLRVQDVPWDQALSIMLKTKGLSQRREGNVIWVAPTTEIVKQESEEAKAKAQEISLAPLVTSFVQLNYAKAEDVVKLINLEDVKTSSDIGADNRQYAASRLNLNGDDSRLLSPRGVVTADLRTNTLVILDTQEKVDQIKRVIGQVDIPVKQVMVEARIVRATTNFSKSMGVKWGVARDSNRSIASNMDNLYKASKYGRQNEAESVDSAVSLDLGQSAGVANIAFGLLNTTDTLLGLELSALQSDGLGEVLSTPKVMTGDKQEATIRSGVKLPYKTVSADSGTNTSFQDAVLELTVTPSITPEGTVQMKLVINKDSQGLLTDAGYAIDTNQLITNVLVNDGETVVLGGLYEDTKTNSVDKVPVMGDIPFLGKLFQSKSKVENKQELLIFITPKVITDPTAKGAADFLGKSKIKR